MPFTKGPRSPYNLTRIQSLRVEDSFPKRLRQASSRAGVPMGVLLGRLVDEFLDGTSGQNLELLALRRTLSEARRRLAHLDELLGVDSSAGSGTESQANSTPEPEVEPEVEPETELEPEVDSAAGFWE